MGEDLYRLVTTGLLGVTVLLLLVAVSQLGRLQKALRPGSATEPSDDRPEPGPVDTASEDVALEARPAPETEVESEPVAAGIAAPAPDDEGPFERDGRWWFRRDGELLVYDEQREEWVDPEHPLDEAKGWDTKGFDASPETPGDQPLDTIAAAPQPVTDSAPQPVVEPVPQTVAEPVPEATPEPVPQAAPEPVAEPAQPTPEPVDAAPVEAAPTTEGPEPGSGGHWKCPSCGVVNGSTATSCRMCFAARP